MRLYQSKELSYSSRNSLYEEAEGKSDIFWRYIEREPHAFLHVGELVRLFKHSDLTNKKVLSIGIDVLKDYVLAKSTGVDLTVFDIDESAVDGAKRLNKIEKANIDYQRMDIFGEKGKMLLRQGKYDVLLLCQMDYAFSDDQLIKLISLAAETHIKHVVVLSPSLYSIATTKQPLLIIRNVIDLGLGMVGALKSRRFAKYNSCTYRRLFKNFNKLLQPCYILKTKLIYQYPSGRIHLLHYSKNAC